MTKKILAHLALTSIAVLLHFLFAQQFPDLMNSKLYVLHVVFGGLGVFTFLGLFFFKALDQNQQTLLLLALQGMRMLVLMAVVIVILSVIPFIDDRVFFFNLFILYLYYTSFDIYFLLRNLRPNSESTLRKDAKLP